MKCVVLVGPAGTKIGDPSIDHTLVLVICTFGRDSADIKRVTPSQSPLCIVINLILESCLPLSLFLSSEVVGGVGL